MLVGDTMAACSCCQLTASCCSSGVGDGFNPDSISEGGKGFMRCGAACLTTTRSRGIWVAAPLHAAPVNLLNRAGTPVCGSTSHPGTDGNCAAITEPGGTSFPVAAAARPSFRDTISCPA